MDAKEYYRTGKHSVWSNSPMRQELLKHVIGWNPKEVFEFGCAGGENLHILQQLGILVYGIDVNTKEVQRAQERLGTITATIEEGDEKDIHCYVKDAFEVSFTCGVLDHIPDIGFLNTISSLEKVTSDFIYCLETNDTPNDYFYPHDYKSAGFVNLKEFETKNGKYILWGKAC